MVAAAKLILLVAALVAGHYMLGRQYRWDSRVVIDEAIAYAEGLMIAGNGKEVWVFDIDETSLSNLPYYAKHGLGYVRTCT